MQQRSPSPESPPPSAPKLNPRLIKQLKQLKKNDLSSPKLAWVAKYQNHSPEEETTRTDYSQQYVDSGGWPQDWMLGANSNPTAFRRVCILPTEYDPPPTSA